MSPAVLTVIIPTVCTRGRRESLLRAIASAQGSAVPGAVTVQVVANGSSVDEAVLNEVSGFAGVEVIQREEGSAPKAQLAGRAHVTTPFFAFLDDDDELLPESSSRRLQALAEQPEADLCITNGWREVDGRRELMQPSLAGVAAEPLRTVLARNWLASSAAVFRSATVGVEFFEEPQPFAEWTWLAYRLLLAGKRVAVVDEPGYVIHDTPGSLSKSGAYFHSYVGLFDRMLASNPPPWARDTLLRKRCAALHDLADQALRAGQRGEAWVLHMQSLWPLRHGLRYASFTWRLAAASSGVRGSGPGRRS